MKQIDLSLNRKNSHYQILIGSGFLAEPLNLLKQLNANKICIISNNKVSTFYLDSISHSIKNTNWNGSIETILIGDGEEYKSLESFRLIMDRLIEKEFKRNDLIIALGGGVIGDLAGYSAASFYRGINFIQVPTSLLAMVDSSVGGKTAINHPKGKNLIGAFHQPIHVRIDTDCLKTLEPRQFSAGMAEIIKIAAIYDVQFFEWLENNLAEILQLNDVTIQQMIYRSCQLKAEIVNKDELEQGVRAILNFGHTFGHAIETLLGYGKLLHGEAVAIGMVLASKFSAKEGMIKESIVDRIIKILKSFELPTELPKEVKANDMVNAMLLDKKNHNENIRLILLVGLAKYRIKEYPSALIESFLNNNE